MSPRRGERSHAETIIINGSLAAAPAPDINKASDSPAPRLHPRELGLFAKKEKKPVADVDSDTASDLA